MEKSIVVKNEFVSKTSDEKELKIADIIAKLINSKVHNSNQILAK